MVPAVALKEAVVAPEATVTDAGTPSKALLLDRATVDPLVGAAWLMVTVQELMAAEARVVGLQASEDRVGDTTGAVRLTVAVKETPRVAVTVAV
jgi:hypothetical protein